MSPAVTPTRHSPRLHRSGHISHRSPQDPAHTPQPSATQSSPSSVHGDDAGASDQAIQSTESSETAGATPASRRRSPPPPSPPPPARVRVRELRCIAGEAATADHLRQHLLQRVLPQWLWRDPGPHPPIFNFIIYVICFILSAVVLSMVLAWYYSSPDTTYEIRIWVIELRWYLQCFLPPVLVLAKLGWNNWHW